MGEEDFAIGKPCVFDACHKIKLFNVRDAVRLAVILSEDKARENTFFFKIDQRAVDSFAVGITGEISVKAFCWNGSF